MSGNYNNATIIKNTYIKSGTYKVVLIVSDSKGFGHTIIKKLVIKDFTIDAGNDKTVCAYDSVQVGLPLDLAAQNSLRYSWTPKQYFTNPNVAQTYFKANAQNAASFGKKIVCYFEVTNIIGGQCKAKDSMFVNVIAPIIAKAGENRTVCSGENSKIGNLIENPNYQKYSYSWTPASAVNNDTLANPIFRADNFGNSTINITLTLTVTDKINACKNIDAITVTVRNSLKSEAGNDKRVCFSEKPFKIGSDNVNNSKNITYSWFPTTHLDNATVLNPTFIIPKNITSTQKLTYVLGTTKDACTTYDSMNIVIEFPPNAVKISGKTVLCPFQQNVEYYAEVADNSLVNYTYNWFVVGGKIISERGNSVMINWFDTNEKAKLRVLPISSTGCQKDTFDLPITILPFTKPLKIIGDTEVCENSLAKKYSLNPTNSTSNYIWQILQNSTVLQTFEGNTITTDWKVTGNYTIQVTEILQNTPCANVVNKQNIKVYSLPETENIEGEKTIYSTKLDNFVYYAKSNNSQTPLESSDFNYIWKVVGGTIIGADNLPKITVNWQNNSSLKTISLTKVTVNGCKGETITEKINFELVAVDNEIKAPNIITPNGDGKNEVFFVENLSLYSDCELEIFNRYNNKVYHSLNYQNNWSGDDGSSGGLYYYILQIPSENKQIKGWLYVLK